MMTLQLTTTETAGPTNRSLRAQLRLQRDALVAEIASFDLWQTAWQQRQIEIDGLLAKLRHQIAAK